MDSRQKSREQELEVWECKLIDQQAELTAALKKFRDSMQAEAAKVQAMAIKVSKRERAVQQKERSLLMMQQRLKASVDAFNVAVEKSSEDLGQNKEVKTYEGKIDGAKGPSYIESLSSDDDNNATGPDGSPNSQGAPHRGLRGSPQHVPLNPDNDNLFFRRKSSIVDLKGREKPMQQKFDDAVEILMARFEPEAILAMMTEQGLTAKDVIAMAENLADDTIEGDDAEYEDEIGGGGGENINIGGGENISFGSGNPIPYMDDTREDFDSDGEEDGQYGGNDNAGGGVYDEVGRGGGEVEEEEEYYQENDADVNGAAPDYSNNSRSNPIGSAGLGQMQQGAMFDEDTTSSEDEDDF